MPSLFQTSFAAGELSPSTFARVDLAKYKVGAATLRNFFVDYRGGASTRMGTQYIGTSATSGGGLPPRLIRFQFSTLQTYVLEFGQGYIGFIKNGAVVTSGGVAYTIASPYALSDLPLLKFTQSADVMTLTHPSYAARQLNRFSDINWTLTTIGFSPLQQAPSGGTATPTHGSEAPASGDTTSTSYTYRVTAVASTGEESEAGPAFSTAANSRIMSTDGNAFVTLSWTAPAGTAPAYYQIYRNEEVPNSAPVAGSLFGLIGSSIQASYVDRDGVPDFTTTPPLGLNPFAGGNNPGVTTYFAQRQWFGGSTAQPETFWASKIGAFANMDKSQPVQASDAITGTIASTQVNQIKHMVPMTSGIVTLSSGGAWLISGGSVGQGGAPAAITPSTLVAQPQAYNGCSDLPPIVANYDVLFVQLMGSLVRDLSFNFYVNIYTGTEMTTLSNHLFANRTLKDWAYAEEPYKVIWCVRDDGILLSFTFQKEQDVYAWTWNDTQGLYQSVCCVQEGTINALYCVVRRFLNNNWVYTIERMANRALIDGNRALNIAADIEKAWCVDCGLSLPQPTPQATLYGGVGSATVGATVQFQLDQAVLSPSCVGQVIRANSGRATITQYLSPALCNAVITTPFPTLPYTPGIMIPAGVNTWTLTTPVTVLTGLGHLEGQTVSILADGNVIAPQTVLHGAITLPVAASSVIVGLGYTCQLQTLALDVGEGQPGGSIAGKQKKVGAVTIRVKDTRGLKAGRTPATVKPIKEWNSTIALGGPLPLVTADQRMILDPLFDDYGQFWLQVDDPVPATVLGVVPEVVLA